MMRDMPTALCQPELTRTDERTTAHTLAPWSTQHSQCMATGTSDMCECMRGAGKGSGGRHRGEEVLRV